MSRHLAARESCAPSNECLVDYFSFRQGKTWMLSQSRQEKEKEKKKGDRFIFF